MPQICMYAVQLALAAKSAPQKPQWHAIVSLNTQDSWLDSSTDSGCAFTQVQDLASWWLILESLPVETMTTWPALYISYLARTLSHGIGRDSRTTNTIAQTLFNPLCMLNLLNLVAEATLC